MKPPCDFCWIIQPNRRERSLAPRSTSLPGLTRQSILFEKVFAKMDGCAGLRLAEAASAAQAGQARA